MTFTSRPSLKVLVLLWMLASHWQSSMADHLALFRRTLVSRTTLMTSRVLEFDMAPSGAFQHHRCSQLCHLRPWCDLWCSDTSGDQCLFSDMIVMPGYKEQNMVDALTCYTRRQKDFATGVGIQGTQNSPYMAQRVTENLVDGIYTLVTLNDCYYTSSYEENHWLVLDFGRPVSFRKVKIFSQTKGSPMILQHLHSLEVRFGMSPVDTLGDFSSYQFFGSFDGPVTEFGKVIVIETLATVTARYLSIQKTAPMEVFQICHLEVY